MVNNSAGVEKEENLVTTLSVNSLIKQAKKIKKPGAKVVTKSKTLQPRQLIEGKYTMIGRPFQRVQRVGRRRYIQTLRWVRLPDGTRKQKVIKKG